MSDAKHKARAKSVYSRRKAFSRGLSLLSEVSPRNLTGAQQSFFLAAALADLAESPATFTELREVVGSSVNRSLHSTYKVFLNEGRIRDGQRQAGIGWLKTEVDPIDNRRKYLRLTPKGRRVINDLLNELELGAKVC